MEDFFCSFGYISHAAPRKAGQRCVLDGQVFKGPRCVSDEGSWPRNTGKYISSYMLKMIFFKNVENFLNSDLSLGEMVCCLYDELEESLSYGFIPLYFMPKVSALSGHKLNIPKSARVAKIMKKFVHAYYQRDKRARQGCEEINHQQRERTFVYQAIEIWPLEDKD